MRKTIISIIQPVYLPWLGYFEQIASADHFVLLDNVDYTKQDWRNRNQIRLPQGSMWLTVPIIRRAHGTPINEVEINYRTSWIDKHLNALRSNYGRCAYFHPLFDEIERTLQQRMRLLWELDLALLQILCAHLAISTPISLASRLSAESVKSSEASIGAESATPIIKRNLRLISLCQELGGHVFYVGAKAANYIDRDLFADAGLEVIFQSYRHPAYPQRYPGFVSHMSAVDLIMNHGPDAPGILRSTTPAATLCKTSLDAAAHPVHR